MSSLTKKKDISISVFIPSGLGGGGAEQVVLNLAQGFKEREFKVDLVLLRTSGVFMAKIYSEIQVIDLGVKTEQPRLALRKLLALMRYLRREQPTVLFAISDTDNIAMWAKRLTGVSTRVITVLQLPFSLILEWMKSRLKRYLTVESYRWVDGIVASSQGVANDLARTANLSLENIKVIYNPMVIAEILEKSKEPITHPWFASGEPPVILGVGRLVKQKDFPTLIKAFSLVRQHLPAKLIIIGEGEKRPELEALVDKLDLGNEIDLPGFQMNPYAYMARANIFVLSSIFEGFGNVIVEAMVVGTPVVSTNCESGPAEILANGKYGNLVPIRDVEALANAIVTTLNKPPNSEILQQRARAFSLNSIITQYLEIAELS